MSRLMAKTRTVQPIHASCYNEIRPTERSGPCRVRCLARPDVLIGSPEETAERS
jgi:hypothetical protein